MQTSTIKAWSYVHKWTSLICTLFMLFLCLTGLPLIFHHEIDHALGHSVDPPHMEGNVEHIPIDTLVNDAQRRQPDEVVQFLVSDSDDANALHVRMAKNMQDMETSSMYSYDARNGELLSEYPIGNGFSSIILRLHMNMYTGLPGTLFLGFMGILLLVSIISGAVLYSPFMKKLQFGDVRRSRSNRVKWLDLHNLLGIVTMAWLFIVSLTGVINTLALPILGQWQATELVEMTAPYRDSPKPNHIVPAATALASAQSAEADMDFAFMALPGNPFAGDLHYMIFMRGQTPLTSQLLKPLLVSAASGDVVDSREMPWYVTLLLISQPLHFGDYGSMPLKILWALLDIFSIILLGSGVYLWLKKYRSQDAEEKQQKTTVDNIQYGA